MAKQLQNIGFMTSYRHEIADKLEMLKLDARRCSNIFMGFSANTAESERSAYHFLHQLLVLCDTGAAHFEFRGACNINNHQDVIWCLENVQTYKQQHRVGLACLLKSEILGLDYIESFLTYILAQLTPHAANLALRIMRDHTILQSIAEAAYESPEQPWCVMDIHDAVWDAMGEQTDTDDTRLFAVLLREFNALQQASLRQVALT